MQDNPRTVLVVGANSREGFAWLEQRFPAAPQDARALVVRLRLSELDAVLWAEALRLEARAAQIVLSIGLAVQALAHEERAAARAACDAFQRACSLGGDITVSHSNLLRAA